MSIASWNILGLLLALAGVLMLFRYGMPFRVPTQGVTYVITNEVDESEKFLERRYTVLGYIGLALIVGGTLLQIYATYLSSI